MIETYNRELWEMLMRQECPRCQTTMMRWYMDGVGWVSVCPFLHVLQWEHQFTVLTLPLVAHMHEIERQFGRDGEVVTRSE